MMLHIIPYAVFLLLIYLAEYVNSENGCDSSIPEVPNASYEIQTYVRNSGTTLKNATYTCDSGYEFLDPTNNVLYCTSQYQWIGDTPDCIEQICDSIPSVPNASYKTEEVYRMSKKGIKVTYTCDPGYQLESSTYFFLRCVILFSRYRWIGHTPKCIENRCGILPTIQNGNYKMQNNSENSVTIGTTATYTCDIGYELENSTDDTLECFFDRPEYRLRWRGNTPRCIECRCGLRPEKEIGSGKVVGGRLAKDPWPWMAALYYRPKVEFLCGGSIIHRNFILTAAHCLYGQDRLLRDAYDLIVELDFMDMENKSSIKMFFVRRIIIHPNYRIGPIFDYDIALLELANSIECNSLFRPVCLPSRESPPDTNFYKPDEYVVAIGWGHESTVGLMENINFVRSEGLKEVVLPIQSPERCRRREGLAALLHRRAISDRMFCAGDGTGGNDTCKGDSGGPVMQSSLNENEDNYWTQVGIVSWGIGCGLANTFGYYTHVQKLVDWVYSSIAP